MKPRYKMKRGVRRRRRSCRVFPLFLVAALAFAALAITTVLLTSTPDHTPRAVTAPAVTPPAAARTEEMRRAPAPALSTAPPEEKVVSGPVQSIRKTFKSWVPQPASQSSAVVRQTPPKAPVEIAAPRSQSNRVSLTSLGVSSEHAAGADLAQLKTCLRESPNDLAQRLTHTPECSSASKKKKSEGVHATIGDYRGRFSEKDFTVTVDGTFR